MKNCVQWKKFETRVLWKIIEKNVLIFWHTLFSPRCPCLQLVNINMIVLLQFFVTTLHLSFSALQQTHVHHAAATSHAILPYSLNCKSYSRAYLFLYWRVLLQVNIWPIASVLPRITSTSCLMSSQLCTNAKLRDNIMIIISVKLNLIKI